MKKYIDNYTLLSPIFDSVFGNEYKLPKKEALDNDNVVETVENLNGEILDIKRKNEHYKAILLVIISIALICLIFK